MHFTEDTEKEQDGRQLSEKHFCFSFTLGIVENHFLKTELVLSEESYG